MYKSRFITCNKSPTLLQDVDSGRGCACVRTGFTWQLSVLSATFFYEPKTTLKYKVKKKKRFAKCKLDAKQIWHYIIQKFKNNIDLVQPLKYANQVHNKFSALRKSVSHIMIIKLRQQFFICFFILTDGQKVICNSSIQQKYEIHM